MLLKLRNRQQLTDEDVNDMFHEFMATGWHQVPLSNALVNRAWSIARQLGQSGIDDALGYAVAEAEDAELWTSDQRFYNAATDYGLPDIVLVH